MKQARYVQGGEDKVSGWLDDYGVKGQTLTDETAGVVWTGKRGKGAKSGMSLMIGLCRKKERTSKKKDSKSLALRRRKDWEFAGHA